MVRFSRRWGCEPFSGRWFSGAGWLWRGGDRLGRGGDLDFETFDQSPRSYGGRLFLNFGNRG